MLHGGCKLKTGKSHLSSRSHITYLEISLKQTSNKSQENSLLGLPYNMRAGNPNNFCMALRQSAMIQ